MTSLHWRIDLLLLNHWIMGREGQLNLGCGDELVPWQPYKHQDDQGQGHPVYDLSKPLYQVPRFRSQVYTQHTP